MTHQASTSTIARAFEKNDQSMLAIKSRCNSIAASSETNPTPRIYILDVRQRLEALVIAMDSVIALGQKAINYYGDQYSNDPTDLSDYTAVRNAADQIAVWIASQMAGGTDLTETDANGNSINLTYTTSQMSGFRSRAATFSSLIS